jgi:hypothetical protein
VQRMAEKKVLKMKANVTDSGFCPKLSHFITGVEASDVSTNVSGSLLSY